MTDVKASLPSVVFGIYLYLGAEQCHDNETALSQSADSTKQQEECRQGHTTHKHRSRCRTKSIQPARILQEQTQGDAELKHAGLKQKGAAVLSIATSFSHSLYGLQ